MKTAVRIFVGIPLAIVLGLFAFYYYNDLSLSSSRVDFQGGKYPPGCDTTIEGVSELISNANLEFRDGVYFMSYQFEDIATGSSTYREVRGRHPPPGFDKWIHNAVKHDAHLNEGFFDQIYHDLEPFWGVEPKQLRNLVAGWHMVIKVRDGKVVEVPNQFMRTKTWVAMISKIVHLLPDMDIPLNHLDEARVMAPFDTINTAFGKARAQAKKMLEAPVSTFADSTTRFQAYAPGSPEVVSWSKDLDELYQAVQFSCPPGTLYRDKGVDGFSDFTSNLERALVQNVTDAKDLCTFPLLNVMHGALYRPATIDFTTSLIPLFTGSKVSRYNDIIIPEPAYYSDRSEFTGKDYWYDWSTWYPWPKKRHALVWRGSATGGRVEDREWTVFHRHRMIALLNATEKDPRMGTADWSIDQLLNTSANVGFTKLYCEDAHDAAACPDLGSHFRLVKPIKMSAQFQYKYLPDIDGNSVSERFRAFMFSNSAPIKATIFSDWHDSRLLPWYHYIPLHTTFTDLYSIITYFLGFEDICAHDDEGRRIAEQGRLWAERVLRKEDMEIYVHRLLLEYARIMHDERDSLGYVADLLEG